MGPRRRAALLLLLSAVAVAGRASADIVHLESGGRIEGKATRAGSGVLVESVAGETKLESTDVVRIDFEHEAPIEVYFALREAARAEPSAEAYLDLAVWALEHRAARYVDPNVEAAAVRLDSVTDAAEVLALADRFEEALGPRLLAVWKRLLELDASSERARRALGYRQLAGRWVTEEEFQVAQGLVRFEGEWMTPVRRDLLERERAERFEERRKAFLRAEAAVTRREKEVAVERGEVAAARRELTSQARQLVHERDRLADWEKELDRRESFLNSLGLCRSCRSYYSGSHICPSVWSLCRRCGGYFRSGHVCR